MTTSELATQITRDAMTLRKAPLPLAEAYTISQRLEEAAASLERLAKIEEFYDKPEMRGAR